MSLTKIDAQSLYIYDEQWTAKHDSFLLEALLAKKDECSPVPPHKSFHAKLCVLDAFNRAFDTSIGLADIEERLAFLEGRHKTFKRISKQNGTHWDVDKNMVIASEVVWEKIIKDDEFAEAYFWKGEPEWRNLSLLFDPDTVKSKPSRSRNVIIISDSPTAKFEPSATVPLNSPYSEGEVTSPPFIAPPVCGSQRRLSFDGKIEGTSKWPSIEKRLQFLEGNAVPEGNVVARESVDLGRDGKGEDSGDAASHAVVEASCASSWAPWP